MRVVVIGGGVAGLACAHALLRVGIRPTVIEPGDARPEPWKGLLLFEEGLVRLASLGLEARVVARGQRLERIDTFRPDGEAVGAVLLDRAVGVLQGHLIEELTQALPAGVVRRGVRALELLRDARGDAHAVRCSDGSEVVGDLFVACDGARSRLRAQVAPERHAGEVRLHEIVGHVDDPDLAAELGPRLVKLEHPAGGLAFGVVPCGAGRLVWYVQLDAERHRSDVHTANERARLVHRLVGDFRHPVPRLLGRTDFEHSRLWHTTDLDALPRLHAANVALAGDAAHVLLPFTGQGAGAALADAEELARALHRALRDGGATTDPTRHRAQIAAALEDYTRSRLPSVRRMVASGRTLRDRFLARRPHGPDSEIPIGR